MDDNKLNSLFFSYQPCASSSSTEFPMDTVSNLSTTTDWTIIPFQDAASNFLEQESPKEVKNELKKAIQVRKIANGEEIPQVEWKKPPTPQPRPPEKPEDIRLRREKNKIAAKKCREKKREKKREYKKRIEKQEEIRSHLLEEVQKLRQEYRELKNLLENHHCIHMCAQPGMSSSTGLEQLAQQTDFNANLLQFNLNCSLTSPQ